MTINNVVLKGYDQQGSMLTLVLETVDLDVAKTCITDNMTVMDGAGNLVTRFTGYTRIQQLALEDTAGTVTAVLHRNVSYDEELAQLRAKLEAENKLLKEQVAAQADQAEFYEDCIAEMASVVYA